jgi:pimeloyl-ACP methyl ester carboxylesterase
VLTLEESAPIQPSERDQALDLHSRDWGSKLDDAWERVGDSDRRHFVRRIKVRDRKGKGQHLLDHIVRFPSAPIYGINRKHDYSYEFAQRPNMHTLRVLMRPGNEPVERLFILHNGLNEADDLRFYYRLADWIFTENPSGGHRGKAACVIVPFAGHLMHAPFHGPFSQTPLSRYLGDAGELFRQFLRYMVQMRWLLSVVANPGVEQWRVGGGIVSAETPDKLPDALGEEWEQLFEASWKLLSKQPQTKTKRNQSREKAEMVGIPVESEDLRSIVAVLRAVLGRDLAAKSGALPTHVIGYSLGGFLAQSVFFAWPQFVSSCTTICSGGAIAALSPTAFAHKEEWQAVLHALHGELEDAMLVGRLSRTKKNTVAGLPVGQFGYFKRVFDQVFLQEDRGSYGERLSEYSSRMLFVSGGEDPIVKPQNVLDASPREGINMLSVANLTHFLGLDPRGADREQEVAQREFWLPEVGRLITRAAIRSEQLVAHELEVATGHRSGPLKKLGKRKRPTARPRSPEELSGPRFETAVDWALEAVEEQRGWLIISRNALPTALLDPACFTMWGKALHHHDASVQRYAMGLRRRAEALERCRDRVTLLLPSRLEDWFVSGSPLFDPQSDTPSGRFMELRDRQQLLDDFMVRWAGCIREFTAGPINERLDGSGLDNSLLISALSTWQGVEASELIVTHLPDVWIGVPGRGKHPLSLAQSTSREEAEQDVLRWVARLVAHMPTPSERQNGQPNQPKDSVGASLQADLDRERLRIVHVSDAELNPRYRGRSETSRGAAARLLAQLAAGLLRSVPRPTDRA